MAMAAESKDESASSRMGVIEINDLVYKLEADLSVAVNRTHKTGYFQNNAYTNNQTSICIMNSGADYIDPRRSFLSLSIQLPITPALGTDVNVPQTYNPYISANLGPNGSVLNFIDSVVVATRSGDELSRINDYAQLMHTIIPWMFGEEWRRTIGQQIGLGAFLGGSNSNGVSSNMVRTRFQIPLYLLSPVFAYGRLLPSMLMSGLRVEIKWKPLEQAVQQYWENTPIYEPVEDTGDDFMTRGKMYLSPSAQYGGLQTDFTSADTLWSYTNTGLVGWATAGTDFDAIIPADPPYPARQLFIPRADVIVLPDPGVATWQREFPVEDIQNTHELRVESNYNSTIAAALIPAPGPYRLSQVPFKNSIQHDFNAKYWGGANVTGATPLSGYNILQPEFSLCSVQMSDAVQRHLNEFSSVNGLEIVYTDWDRTSAPLNGAVVPVYTEIRKSASRALQLVAVVTDASSDPFKRNSFASIPNSTWDHYQVQLGSLYFPQQRVEDRSGTQLLRQDGMYSMCYAYALDSFDRFHPKAAPTMLSLRGDSLAPGLQGNASLDTYAEFNPDTYLVPNSIFGKYGSFANGALCIATTLERSTMFDLSGIPINNSRVLAIRGDFRFPANGTQTGTLFGFLKYVRVARVFLINVEVEQ